MTAQPNANGTASVVFDGVTKAFGSVVAVDNVSLTINPGELVTLLGPSGCGKTTTLRMIAGLEMATSGRIMIGGADVTALPATDRDVSMVFQSYALFPHMSVVENTAYGLVVSGMARRDAHARAEQGLAQVGLEGYGARLPSELSGGQQQRVAVARALVLEPQVLLFDEPLSNLDAKLRRQVREDIRDLQRGLNLTTVYVTHDQEEALAVSDRIIVMRNAQIAQEGTPNDLYERPIDVFVADFIGDANLVTGEITAVDNGSAQVNVGAIARTLPLPRVGDHRPGPASVAIRPEAVRLAPAETDARLQGRIAKATYLGSHIEYTVTTDLGDLFVVDHRVQSPFAVDTTVAVDFAERGVTLVNQAP